MRLHDTAYWKMAHETDAGIVSLHWTEATAEMKGDDFKRALELFAGFAEEYQPKGLMVDVRRFRHRPAPDVGEWRTEHITPRYNRAGISRFAYLIGPDFPAPPGAADGSPARQPGEDFETGFFEDETAARTWLAGG